MVIDRQRLGYDTEAGRVRPSRIFAAVKRYSRAIANYLHQRSVTVSVLEDQLSTVRADPLSDGPNNPPRDRRAIEVGRSEHTAESRGDGATPSPDSVTLEKGSPMYNACQRGTELDPQGRGSAHTERLGEGGGQSNTRRFKAWWNKKKEKKRDEGPK